jgi:TPR repeat protein
VSALKRIAGAALLFFSLQAAHAQQSADQSPAPGKAKPVSAKGAPALPRLSPAEAARRYAHGEELERGGDAQGAFAAYRAAAESGHGLAQKKLGDIYGGSSPVVERDYETSLRWYDRARQQGVEIPQPFTYSGVRQSPQVVARAQQTTAPVLGPGAGARSASADTKPQSPQVTAAIPAPTEVKPQPAKPAFKPELKPQSKPVTKPEAKAPLPVAPSPKPAAKPDKPAPEKPAPKPPPVPRPADKIGGDHPLKPPAKPAVEVVALSSAVATPPARAAPAPLKLGPAEAARRYSDGVELERRGDSQGALIAYLAAGESGNGLAQRRLGDIYGMGKPFVERDYETSLHWYERARKQGIDVPKPFSYTGVRQ